MLVLGRLAGWDSAPNPDIAIVLPSGQHFELRGLEAYLARAPKPIACVAPTGMPRPCLFHWAVEPADLKSHFQWQFSQLLIEQLGSQGDAGGSKVRIAAADSHSDISIPEYSEWSRSYLFPLNPMKATSPDSHLAAQGVLQIVEIEPWSMNGPGEGLHVHMI
jgi:hypothetical protein